MTDVCLILEGTYPYKTGGVTTWIQTLVRGLPGITFSVAHLYYGEKPDVPKVGIPSNVESVALISLNEMESVVSMSELVERIPSARIYHPLSTGFAGLLGTELKRRTGKPLVLTEHGIYWHEVSLGADELECGFKIVKTESGELQLGRTWEAWHQAFQDFARDAYAAADVITTVCSFNQDLQRSLGASGSKMQLIPNGVEIPVNGRTAPGRTGTNAKKRIALVGRVTPIKDVKTFIRACALVQKRIQQAEFQVIGPTDHDSMYAAECRELAESLSLDALEFTGETDMGEQYPSIDLVVLTSVSEGQPYALLESFAHGIPVVATNVGGCAELVDRGNIPGGPAGLICPVGDHRRIADAIIELCSNQALYQQCAAAGRTRARDLYSHEAVIASYKQLYDRYLNN
jgi:polysaccharide biosynthesis protein PelF